MQKRKRMSAGWSFAVGVLFGALAVLLPLSSSGTPGHKAESSMPKLPALVEPRADANTPPVRSVADAHDDFSKSPEPTGVEKRRRRPTIQAPQTASHSELALQLD